MKNDIFIKFCQEVEQMVSLLPGFKTIRSTLSADAQIVFDIHHLDSIQNDVFNQSVISTIKFWLNTQEAYQKIDFDTNISLTYVNLIPKKKLTRTVVCPECNKTFYYQMTTHCEKNNCQFKTS